MAKSKKITSEESIEKDIFQNTIESADKLISKLEMLIAGFRETLKLSKEFLQSQAGKGQSAAELKAINEELRKVKITKASIIDTEKKLIQVSVEKEKLEQQRLKTEKATLQVEKQKETAQKKQAAGLAREAKEAQKLFGEYQKGTKRLAEIKKLLKELEFSGRTNGKVYKALGAEFLALNGKVRDAEEGVGEFQRSVGNYREAIRLAIGQTGLFDSGIARLAQSLITLRKNQDKTASSTKNFTQLLKLAGIGLAIAAIGALVKTLQKGAELSQSLSDTFLSIEKGATAAAAAVSSFRNAIDAATAAGQYVKVLRETRTEVIRLRSELQALILDEEDFNEIAADATIGFKQREAALEKAFELRTKAAKLEVEIAKQQLDAANKELSAAEVAVGQGNASLEIKERQLEAQLNFNEAVDKENDLLRINSQRQRQLNSDRAIAEIELLRSKRQNAKAAQEELQRQLNDEKIQLEERIKINKKLLQVNRQTTNEEIKIFKEKIGIEFNSNELLAEQDAVILKRKLENLKTLAGNGLGEAALNELSKIIKSAQDDQIKFQENSIKLDDEAIKRKQRLLQINQDIAKLVRDDQVNDASIKIEERRKELEKATEKAFRTENLFNTKIQEERKKAAFNLELAIEQERVLKEDNLRRTAEAEKKRIEETVTDEKLKAAELKKIETQLNIDLENLQQERLRAAKASDEEDLERIKQLEKEKAKVIAEQTKAITDVFFEELDKRDERRRASLEKELEEREENIEVQRKLAEKGLDNQLAFEIAQKKKAELAEKEAEERAAKRKKAQQLAEAYLAAFIAELEKEGATPQTAAFKALANVLIAEGIGAGLAGAFKDGVEKIEGPGTTTSDSILALLSKDESVITAQGTNENPGLATAINKGTLKNYTEDVLIPKFNLQDSIKSADIVSRSTDDKIANSMFMSKLSDLERAIKEIPGNHIEIDRFGNVLEKRIINKVTKMIIHKEKTRLG